MTKNIGIGTKKVLPVPTTDFERDLVIALEGMMQEIEDTLENLESRIVALEP